MKNESNRKTPVKGVYLQFWDLKSPESKKKQTHTVVEDDDDDGLIGFYKRPKRSYDWSQSIYSLRPDELSGPREDSDNKKELCNFGRVPLNWDFDADRARPLPSSDEGTYGGGARSTRGIEAPTLSNGSQHVNGASTSHVAPKGVKLSKQKPTHLVNRSVTVTQKKMGCFGWF